MNGLLTMLGIESWKPVIAALLLPPVPFLVLVLLGARLILPRRGLGWFVTLVAVAGLWLSACTGTARLLNQFALRPPAPLSLADIADLKDAARAKQPMAIVVLGGGSEVVAPEYGVANLRAQALERLRYGIWLHRETGIPVMFSGGVGWAQRTDSQAEAQIAARIAAQDFGRPIKWVEDSSRDTRENGIRAVAMLEKDQVRHVLLVTHGIHMPRAVAAFEAASGGRMRVQPAPMGLGWAVQTRALDWVPSTSGFERVRGIAHELLGRLAGA